MKRVCFNGAFTEHYFGFLPRVRYITQTKDAKDLSGLCLRELYRLMNSRNGIRGELVSGVWYIVAAHTTVVKRLEDTAEINLPVKPPVTFKSVSIENLRKYLAGEKTKCASCGRRACCHAESMLDRFPSEKKTGHFLVFRAP